MFRKSSPQDNHEPDEHDPDLSLLAHDKQAFYLRLLQRDNSSLGLSSRRRLSPSLVPFLWESSPGLPKPIILTSDHHHDTGFCLAPPPILCSFRAPAAPRCVEDASLELRSADDSWLRSQIKAALRRRRSRRSGSSLSSVLLRGSAGSVNEGRDEAFSPTSMLDMQGQLASTSSSDSEHYQLPGSAKHLTESKSRGRSLNHLYSYKPIVQFSSRLNKKITSTKIKSCCCFRISDCEV